MKGYWAFSMCPAPEKAMSPSASRMIKPQPPFFDSASKLPSILIFCRSWGGSCQLFCIISFLVSSLMKNSLKSSAVLRTSATTWSWWKTFFSAFTLFLVSHQIHISEIRSPFLSWSHCSIASMKSLGSGYSLHFKRRSSSFRSCQNFLTCLHCNKRCPPSSWIVSFPYRRCLVRQMYPTIGIQTKNCYSCFVQEAPNLFICNLIITLL